MNKKLFEKVKEQTKDYGLSEKYLTAITEKLGGSIDDNSTDDEIEKTANLIQELAKEGQGEATRWANKKSKDKDKLKDDDKDKSKKNEDEDEDHDDDKDKSKKDKGSDDRIKALEEEIAKMKSERDKGERSKQIQKAMSEHKIPEKFRDRLARSIGDDEDIEEAVKAMKQDFITDGLAEDESEGVKTASEKQVDDASEDLLKGITAK